MNSTAKKVVSVMGRDHIPAPDLRSRWRSRATNSVLDTGTNRFPRHPPKDAEMPRTPGANALLKEELPDSPRTPQNLHVTAHLAIEGEDVAPEAGPVINSVVLAR